MGKIAFVFPGQGSQAVGMGQAVAREHENGSHYFNVADERLGISLSSIMFNGPMEELTKTVHAQPALVTTSIAIMELLTEAGITPDYTAGHSLGEYSALVASGAITFPDAVYIVSKRGEFMEEAVPNGEGSMAAVLGLEREVLEKITDSVTKDGHSVQLANLNCPGQIVISGTVIGVEKAGEQAKTQGAKRVLPLQVSGPFHSSLMQPAAERFRSVLNEIDINNVEVPVIANVTATPIQTSEEIREKLVEQLYSPVLWEDSVNQLIELGVDTFIEIGPGKVLSGLIRKINRNVKTYSVQDPEGCQIVINDLKGGE